MGLLPIQPVELACHKNIARQSMIVLTGEIAKYINIYVRINECVRVYVCLVIHTYIRTYVQKTQYPVYP